MDTYDNQGVGLDLSFWPSFADSMLALVFVLVLIIALVSFNLQIGTIQIGEIQKKQLSFIYAVAEMENARLDSTGGHIAICNDTSCDIKVYPEIQLLRVSFSDRVLFDPDKYYLKESGQQTLRSVGLAIQSNLQNIYKIQIEGHTDNRPSSTYESGNLELGAKRAISVYQFFQEQIGLDPSSNLMSATSYGEFKPAVREDTTSFSAQDLIEANVSDSLRGLNRRIELLLFYRVE